MNTLRCVTGRWTATLLATVVLAAGCERSTPATPATPPPPAPAARADAAAAAQHAIADFNRRYLGAINDGDIDALASLTTDGHMMIGSGRPPIIGKQALVDAMTRVFDTFSIDESWTPEETVASGDLAYQRGTYVVVATPQAGGDATRSTGHFLRIYRRQPDGAWLMVRDMLSADQPR